MMNWALGSERDIRSAVVKCERGLETSLQNCKSNTSFSLGHFTVLCKMFTSGAEEKVEFLLLFTTFNKPEIITK